MKQLGISTLDNLTFFSLTWVPQECIWSPLSYSLFTDDCIPVNDSNSVIKFAHDTTMVGLIRGNDETFREEIQQLVAWREDNNLELIIKERRRLLWTLLIPYLGTVVVMRVPSLKFSEDLIGSQNSAVLIRKGTIAPVLKSPTSILGYWRTLKAWPLQVSSKLHLATVWYSMVSALHWTIKSFRGW